MRILVVGQGIAGTALAWALLRRGAHVHVADADLPHPASTAAAGLINPVTGKFYVKTWRYDEFFPVARRFYAEIEAALGIRIWSEARVLRPLDTPKAANDWDARCGDPAYARLLGVCADAGLWQPMLTYNGLWGETRGAARVDFPQLLSAFRAHLARQGLFLFQKIMPEEALRVAADYDAVVFCEGWRGALNPFFPNLPWRLTAGEALLIRLKAPGAPSLRDVLKKNLLFIPLSDGLVWVGATYRHWSPTDPVPAPNTAAIEEELACVLRAPFERVSVASGIRPTVRDRRPLLGSSAQRSEFFMFNGLGTKGALLAPYWAEHMAQHLLKGSALSPEVRLDRI
ncbi:MAG: FAD-dependent oxidoreductase [Saprospiraceae bacterium]|nr:FAD-binding oxidoreductase [Saprospiraceae bacterium]MDW8230549.1 FAD-dependent oxidoreductase [Saprospiraceae bacterium]